MARYTSEQKEVLDTSLLSVFDSGQSLSKAGISIRLKKMTEYPNEAIVDYVSDMITSGFLKEDLGRYNV